MSASLAWLQPKAQTCKTLSVLWVLTRLLSSEISVKVRSLIQTPSCMGSTVMTTAWSIDTSPACLLLAAEYWRLACASEAPLQTWNLHMQPDSRPDGMTDCAHSGRASTALTLEYPKLIFWSRALVYQTMP